MVGNKEQSEPAAARNHIELHWEAEHGMRRAYQQNSLRTEPTGRGLLHAKNT